MTVRERVRSWAVSPYAWGFIGLLVVAMLIIGADRPPTTGDSEDRVYSVARQVKCLVCVGESVANSEAQFAVTVRDEIRRQARQGRTDDEILSALAESYGEEIRLVPGASGVEALVWILPVVVVAGGVGGLAVAFGRWRRERHEPDDHAPSDADIELVAAARAEEHGESVGDGGASP